MAAMRRIRDSFDRVAQGTSVDLEDPCGSGLFLFRVIDKPSLCIAKADLGSVSFVWSKVVRHKYDSGLGMQWINESRYCRWGYQEFC